MMTRNLCIDTDKFLVRIGRGWYGLSWFWQSLPLFGRIYMNRKHNTQLTYGIIIFGLNIFFFANNPLWVTE